MCSANPKLGLEPAVHNITPPAVRKRVAVIGGGPAGMWAAMTAGERGHQVTLYEKEASLGGLLRHTDFSPYKWGLRRYKDYLIRQVEKAGIEVRLNTAATPEMIRNKSYDVVVAAVGAKPGVARIPGADSKNVYNIVDAYPREKELGKNVVVIGGGEYGVGTGMFLANAGHRTIVIAPEKELLPISRHHYEEIIIHVYEHLKNFDFISCLLCLYLLFGTSLCEVAQNRHSYHERQRGQRPRWSPGEWRRFGYAAGRRRRQRIQPDL